MILIVDDHVDNCEVLIRFLEADGFDATCVHSGQDALDCLAASLPAVVVLDDFMPGMTGLEVIRRLRENPRYASLPVVFYSAGHDEKRRERAMELSAAAWLDKGRITWDEVVSKIAALAAEDGPRDQ